MRQGGYNKKISVRVTDEEFIVIDKNFALSGRKNRSKFYRDLLLKQGQISPVTRIGSLENNEKLRIILIEWRAEFKKIGVNYNQMVKQINAHPSERRLFGILNNIQKLTQALIRTNDDIIKKINLLTNDRKDIQL